MFLWQSGPYLTVLSGLLKLNESKIGIFDSCRQGWRDQLPKPENPKLKDGGQGVVVHPGSREAADCHRLS